MIVVVAETGSTNADLLARTGPAERLEEGDWLIADRQSAGRGRLGRDWFDGNGNFMGSTAIDLRSGDPQPATLALVAGVALHETAGVLAPHGSDLKLKWPNDLLLDGGKLAGILLERQGDRVVAGFGVNLAVAPEVAHCRTATLKISDQGPDRNAFAEDLAAAFAQELTRWRNVGLAPLLRRWEALAHPVGTPLQTRLPGEGEISGRFAGLDEAGNLRLQTDAGIRTIHAGEVSLVGSGQPG
ncbi:biotin--[acetyl-CoA-carboxylase] ligase [Novosphingobium aquimarinum]|uniref:biotin--[acetyl-CoA-carboxylase] ligase n=1 Tax=Novosphingobium aquimarinum TaxID=2682494 RepID=UPI0012EB9382|nr:biotin--[acetyl-CoA-carboxylase] ligase [Novosphingobium aquimarinum]